MPWNLERGAAVPIVLAADDGGGHLTTAGAFALSLLGNALFGRSDGAHMLDEPLEPLIERGRHRINSDIIVIEQAHR